MTNFGGLPPDYTEEDIEKFRNAYVGDSKPADDEDKDPNYECQKCENKKHIDDHKMHATAYCDANCNEIRQHRRLE